MKTTDLNRIAAFVQVVHEGTFTGAARTLGLPKSSVSRNVSQLEHELGIRLLHRTTRKIRLTDAGVAFYERAGKALSDIDEATVAASNLQTVPSGTVRVTAPVDFGVWALAPLVTRFVRKHPTIHVDLSLTGRVVDLAAEGFDLALRAGPLRDSMLVVRKVGVLETGLYASRGYAERCGVPKTVEELAEHTCVLFRSDGPRSTWHLSRPDGAEAVAEVKGSMNADDLTFVRKATLGGAGIGLIPVFLCEREEAGGKLVRVLPGWRLTSSVVHLVYPSARFVPQRVVLFREFLLEKLPKMM